MIAGQRYDVNQKWKNNKSNSFSVPEKPFTAFSQKFSQIGTEKRSNYSSAFAAIVFFRFLGGFREIGGVFPKQMVS